MQRLYSFFLFFILKILTHLNLFVSSDILDFKDIIFIIYNNYTILESPKRLEGVIINLKDFNLKRKKDFRLNISFFIFDSIIIGNFC